MHRSSLSLLVLVLAAAQVPAADARACGNSVAHATEVDVASLDGASLELDADRHQAAVDAVLRAFPRAHRKVADGELMARGQRMLAVAVVRSGGAVRLDARLRGRTTRQRDAALAWATGTLRAFHAARRDDGTITVELAEALARGPATRGEALALLRDLGHSDLLPSARAWGLLAALERVGGDGEAAARAQGRCAAIDGDGAACVVELRG
jgi:hypothetical protein